MFFSKLDLPSMLFLITVVLATLKLSGDLDWPWLVVLAPLWIVPTLTVAFGLLVLAVIFIAAWLIHAIERYK